MKFLAFTALLFLSIHVTTYGQQRPIGHWRAHMPYNAAVGVTTDGVNLYTITNESFFIFNSARYETSTYSKANGMSDAMMRAIAHDPNTGYTILAYQNSNVDVFRNGSFYNLPDIKLRTFNGDKNIYQIYMEGGLAYLSTGFGVVVVNPERKEIKETYSFVANNQNVPVKSFIGYGNFFYAATRGGLFCAPKSAANLQAFSSWEKVDSRIYFNRLATVNNKLFASEGDTVFYLNNGTLQPVFNVVDSVADIMDIKASNDNNLWVTITFPNIYRGVTLKLDLNTNQIVDSFKNLYVPRQTVQTADGLVWIADEGRGLVRAPASNATFEFIKPYGPATYTTFDILPYNNEVWVAHGSIDDKFNYKFNRNGISHFKDEQWTYYNQATDDSLRKVDGSDYIGVMKDPSDGTVYATSFRSGMFAVYPDGRRKTFKAPYFNETTTDGGAYRVGNIAFDSRGNLWTTQALTTSDLVMKNKNGQWFRYQGPGVQQQVMYIAIDDYDQKWYGLPGRGIAVLNDNGTPENPADDRYRVLNMGNGMPGNMVYSLARDKQGAIWIGTDNGIGIVSCPGDVISGRCGVDKPIVQFDQFAGYLFQNEKVTAIAVDGANRKWVGTSNGAWLISADGSKIIERFTAENSPLPANGIQDIAVDPVSGDVYFGTDLGLVSYRYNATDGGETNENVLVFPNPVASGYNGTIAIRGLVENADVRITDISGQLVYRTKANGGQATWNGKDYTGRRPQSGVYMIFITNNDGSQTDVGKMVFLD